MKTIFASLLVFISLLSLPTQLVLAQTSNNELTDQGDVQEIINPALKLTMSSGGQTYPNKQFTVSVTITSLVDSGKVGIEWIYSSNLFELVGSAKDSVTVIAGETKTVSKTFKVKANLAKPSSTITTEFATKVTALAVDQSYLAVSKTKPQFNSEYELLPVDSKYQNDKIFNQIIGITEVVLVILVIAGIIGFAVSKFIKYLRSDDSET